jgi:hypothetical protein
MFVVESHKLAHFPHRAAHEHPASPIRIPHTHCHRHVGLGASPPPPSLPDGPLWAVSNAMHGASVVQ